MRGRSAKRVNRQIEAEQVEHSAHPPPAGRVLACAQERHRIAHGREVEVYGAPFRYDGERPPLVRPAPTLGEHTEEVLAELGIVRVAG